MKKKNIIIIVASLLVLIILGMILVFINTDIFKKKETDSEKFSKEYTGVSSDNAFIYKNIDEIINILEHGTGIVYLGFPECKWCQKYVIYLNDIAKETNTEKIYYYNILEDRTNRTKEYLKIVELLENYLQYDEEGNKRVYVPTVVAVKKGEIVGFDDETAWDTKGYSEPEEYWTVEEVNDLKDRLKEMMDIVNGNVCSECNIK